MQRPVQAKVPCMIGAGGQPFVAIPVHQPMAPVRANIGIAAQGSLTVEDKKILLAMQCEGEKIAGVPDVADVAYELPNRVEKVLFFQGA